MRSSKRNPLLREAAADKLNSFMDLWLHRLGRKPKNAKKKKPPPKKKQPNS